MDFNQDNLPDIETLAVEDRELNRHAKPVTGYHEPQEVLNFLAGNPVQKQIPLHRLAVNGEIAKDQMETYLKNPAISSSALKEVLKTPLHYFYHINQTIPKKRTRHFDLGTFAHMAFLEPKLFDQVIVEPKCSLTELKGCDTMIEFYEEELDRAVNEGLVSVSVVKDFHACKRDLTKITDKKSYIESLKKLCPYMAIENDHKIIIDVLKKNYYRYGNGIIPKLLKGCIHEVSFYGVDVNTGLDVKVRPDGFNTKENIGVDAVISFKTTKSDNLNKFFYDSAAYEYELSEGMYQEVISHITGREVKTTIMIMLQTCPPFLPAVLWWNADDLENGKYKYHSALTTVKECVDKGKYPGFDAMAESGMSGIIKMKQPDWVMKELLPSEID